MRESDEARTRLLAHLKRRHKKRSEVYYLGTVQVRESIVFHQFAVHYRPKEYELWRVYPDQEPQFEETVFVS